MHQVTVVGAQPDFGPEPAAPRRPIGELIQDRKQWTLYVLAHQAMMVKPQDAKDQLSWFQIEGIHGLPYVPWDEAEVPIYPGKGYCTHGSNLFPTWHRAYVALFEQVLQSHAVAIATTYEADQPGWYKAALALRSPYWDWAGNTPPPDEIIRQKTVAIYPPSGQIEVANPLYGYRFNPIDDSFQPPFKFDTTTVRNPKPGEPSPRKSDPDLLLQSLGTFNARKAMYATLTLVNEWRRFANDQSDKEDPEPVANSLEKNHDTMHNLIGGLNNEGHMSDIAYAAFDPIFWLHHTEVDRLFSLWQAMHPTVWVTPEKNPSPGKPDINEQTDLTPFWNGPTTFWTSAYSAMRSWRLLNYDYPEFAGLKNKTPDEIRAAITQKVNEMYGPPGKKGPFAGHELTEWYIRVRSGRFALGTSYTVLVFVGEPPADLHEWRESPALVGFHAVFVSSQAEHCGNCSARADSVEQSVVHINDRLEELDVLDKPEEDIEQYLRETLHWRVLKIDGTVVDAADIAELDVAALTIDLQWSGDNGMYELPVDGEPKHHDGVTRGRVGGRGYI